MTSTDSAIGESTSSQGSFVDADRFEGATTLGLCGVQVMLDHVEPSLSARLNRLWQQLFVTTRPSLTSEAPAIHLKWSSVCDDAGSDRGQLLSDASGLRIESRAGGFYLDCGSANLRVDLASSVGRGLLTESFFQLPLDAQRRFLLLAIVMLIRRHQCYAVHAGGVSRAGKGCLIAGRSGSGKTTLGLSLIRQGWSNLSDDVVLLRNADEGIQAHGVNRGFSCTRHTAERFGALLNCQGELGEKRVMQFSEAKAPPATRCRPGLILFPTIEDRSDSQLIPIRPIEAVHELIQFSAGIMINQSESSQQLEILTRLVAQSRVFRFIAGRDVFDYPEQVDRLISQQLGHDSEAR